MVEIKRMLERIPEEKYEAEGKEELILNVNYKEIDPKIKGNVVFKTHQSRENPAEEKDINKSELKINPK